MKSQIKWKIFVKLLTILVLATIVKSTEIQQDVPNNHKESVTLPITSSLKIEARGDTDGLDINDVEGKSKNSASITSVNDKTDKQPIILGATSKVAIVYSERKSTASDKEKNIKAPRVVYPQKPTTATNDRNWRVVKVSSRDSYLDALEHSQTSKDSRADAINTEAKIKIPKLIRRDYNEGPVYRHPHEHYAGTREPASTYHLPQDVNNRLVTTKNIARISYGGPTPEPFSPTPSDSYSLPIQSSVKFNNGNDDNHGFYGSSQISYGPPSPQTQIYDSPSNSYNRYPSFPQNSYGPPANNGYPPAGIPQQAYGPPSPSSTYGAPYAIQDYSQQISSMMPSIDLSWPFALKLNAFTLAKILLKLVIFKMIVKFIALICLLLFIPKLEIIKKGDSNDDSEDSDDGRRLFSKDSNLERLNILTAFVTSSIDKYNGTTKISGKSNDSTNVCTSFSCRMRQFVAHEETWNDYARLFKNYVTEETNVDNDNQEVRDNLVDS